MSELKFKVGDHVMVLATVEETDVPDAYRLKLDDGCLIWVPESALASATLVERPLAVGEKVVWNVTGHTYRISSIDDGLAIIRRADDQNTVALTGLRALRRAEERG